MKLIILSVLCAISTTLAASLCFAKVAAEACSDDVCSGGCYCSKTNSPLPVDQTPQFITLTFNDAVTDDIYSTSLMPLLQGRTNPDGNQIGATFYVPHEYTDYERVNNLYNLGFDIAVHSITKNAFSSYWQEATVEALVQEFGGQREIISKFANILIEDITGARVPNLEMAGDKMFKAYQQSGIEYDNSWVALNINRYFPYTLDYRSTQPCNIGSCPGNSFAGVWELPIVDLIGSNGIECNSLYGCNVSGTANQVATWLTEQFINFYNGTRAPMTLTINNAWFVTSPPNYEGFVQFLDSLKSYNDVYLISHRQLVDWMKNPVPVSEFKTATYARDQKCKAVVCPLKKDDAVRYMKSCVPCPEVYPWLGNPQGE